MIEIVPGQIWKRKRPYRKTSKFYKIIMAVYAEKADTILFIYSEDGSTQIGALDPSDQKSIRDEYEYIATIDWVAKIKERVGNKIRIEELW